jgi:protoporphyrinogen oxidase
MMYEYYGTLAEANEYFDNRLHEQAWYDAPANDRPKALIKASQIIDNLSYKGEKAAVVAVMYDSDWNELDATDEELRDANLTQPLEFPRGDDTEVPDEILIACWET